MFTRFAIVVAVGVCSGGVLAQAPSSQPTNNLPNPYRTVENYFTLPEGRTWGSTSTVDIDRDGKSIWVAERCGANTCAGSDRPIVYKFDASGKVLASWGAGMFVFPHGIHIDAQDNVWIADGLGHKVLKLSPDGKVLLTLGTPGVPGADQTHFNQPSDVVTAPNGDIFVADGHGGPTNARIVKFDKNGKFITTWGKMGTGPGEFDVPHALAMDSKGRLFVADRANNRLQMFDQNGKFLEAWPQFSRPSGLFITRDDMIYVADSESNIPRAHGEWKRGIRIGSLKDGKVTAFIPDPNPDPAVGPLAATSSAEGVAVDAPGNIYGAEVGNRALKKYVKQ